MSTDYWKEAIKEARKQRTLLLERRAELLVEQEEVDAQIVKLEQAISSLATLAEENQPYVLGIKALDGLGLADACRVVVNSTDRYMTPVMIRDALKENGFDFSQYTNEMASIHSVLRRFADNGSVLKSADAYGNVIYKRPDPPVYPDEKKLIDAIYTVLKPDVYLTLIEIADKLEGLGFDVREYPNFQIGLEAILKNMEVQKLINWKENKISYRLTTQEDRDKAEKYRRERAEKPKFRFELPPSLTENNAAQAAAKAAVEAIKRKKK